MDSMCRICLVEFQEFEADVFVDMNEENLTLQSIILICTGIAILEAEDFPSKICTSCTENILSSYELRKNVQRSCEFFQVDDISDEIEYLNDILNEDDQILKVEDASVEDPIKHEIFDEENHYEDAVEPEEIVNDPFKCTICDQKFYNTKSLSLHNRMHVIKKSKKPEQFDVEEVPATAEEIIDVTYECTLCGASFDNERSLSVHSRKHFAQKKAVGKLYAVEALTELTLEVEQTPSPPKASADETVEKGEDKAQTSPTIKPKRRRRTKNDASHVCSQCGKQYRSRYALKQHEEAHNGKRYKCELCPKLFRKRTYLNIHKNVHLNIKPYKCKYCDKEFTYAISLRTHLPLHEGKKYKCELCEKYFPIPATRNRHMLTHTNSNSYVCYICNFSTYGSSSLAKHMKKHMTNKGKDLPCPICDKKFDTNFAVKAHMFIHNTIPKPFCCEFCGYQAITRYRIKKHMESIHPEHVETNLKEDVEDEQIEEYLIEEITD